MPTDGRSECRADAHERQVEREACGSRALPHGVLLQRLLVARGEARPGPEAAGCGSAAACLCSWCLLALRVAQSSASTSQRRLLVLILCCFTLSIFRRIPTASHTFCHIVFVIPPPHFGGITPTRIPNTCTIQYTIRNTEGGGGGGHRANAAAVACNGPTSKAGPGRAAMADAVQYPAGLRIWTERALQRCSSQVEARQVAESIQVAATR